MSTIIQQEKVNEIVKKLDLKHIAIIMDGNRRWAKARKIPTTVGHSEGVKSLKKIVKHLSIIGVKYLTVYAFSTENWNRKKEEVDFLMKLLKNTIQNELLELYDNGVKLNFIGDLSKFSDDMKNVFDEAVEKTSQNSGLNLQIAINYGARDEILNAVKKIAQKVKKSEIEIQNIDEDLISNHLYTVDLPNPDLLIRTGGEQRISNYLLWQIAYSELYITEKMWPEFDETQINEAILEFATRERRFGKG